MRYSAVAETSLLPEKVADQVTSDYEQSQLDEAQRVVLRYTDAFLGRAAMSDDLAVSLLGHLGSEEAVVVLSTALALFSGFAKVVISLGLEPDQMATSVWPIPGPNGEVDVSKYTYTTG